MRSILYDRFCSRSVLQETKYKLFHNWGKNTLKISMKSFVLAKLNTSSKQLKRCFLVFWLQLKNSYFEELISVAGSVINSLQILQKILRSTTCLFCNKFFSLWTIISYHSLYNRKSFYTIRIRYLSEFEPIPFGHRDRRKKQRELISISVHLSKMLIASGLFKNVPQIILNILCLRLWQVLLVEISLCKLLWLLIIQVYN